MTWNEIKDYLKIKHALHNGDFTLSVAEKIFKRMGRKTEIVALVEGVHPYEITDEIIDNYCEISSKKVK